MRWYTVWDTKNDNIIACGFRDECARRMNRSIADFDSTVCLAKKGKLNKYTVLVEDVECTKNEAEKIRKEARRIEDYLDRSRAEMERDYTSRELSAFLQKYRWKKATVEQFIHDICMGAIA